MELDDDQINEKRDLVINSSAFQSRVITETLDVKICEDHRLKLAIGREAGVA
jgi:hypothetical protein